MPVSDSTAGAVHQDSFVWTSLFDHCWRRYYAIYILYMCYTIVIEQPRMVITVAHIAD